MSSKSILEHCIRKLQLSLTIQQNEKHTVIWNFTCLLLLDLFLYHFLPHDIPMATILRMLYPHRQVSHSNECWDTQEVGEKQDNK